MGIADDRIVDLEGIGYRVDLLGRHNIINKKDGICREGLEGRPRLVDVCYGGKLAHLELVIGQCARQVLRLTLAPSPWAWLAAAAAFSAAASSASRSSLLFLVYEHAAYISPLPHP